MDRPHNEGNRETARKAHTSRTLDLGAVTSDDPRMTCNPRQTQFVREYLKDRNATQAYIRAGYAEAGASQGAERLLRNVEIKASIAQGELAAAERAALSVDWVLEELHAAYVVSTALGQMSTAHAALVSLGKHIGMWPTKITITDGDREAARAAAAVLGLDEDEVLAEVERELREARA